MKTKIIFLSFLLLSSFLSAQQKEEPISSQSDSLPATLPAWTSDMEKIIRFHSDILVDTTGRIQVTEEIIVNALGDEIKRGIVRRIPVYRKDRYGQKQKVDISILSVLCNGEDVAYKEEYNDGEKEIYIGDADSYLTPAVYKYTICYESYGQIGFFDDYDELYWNVTGNGWDFEIEHASATVRLPDGVSGINTACYTGESGSTEKDCFSDNKGNLILFEARSVLNQREGFTIAVSFPRDIIKRPPPPSAAEIFWMKYKELISAFLCLLVAGCYFFFTWKKVGRDPEQPVAIPTFRPPHDWSPAVVRYLYKRKYDDKALTVTLVGMAVKGVIRIVDNLKTYTLKVTGGKELLADEEKSVFNALLSAKNEIAVSDKNHSKFSNAISGLKNSLEARWDLKDYFLKNLKYIVIATFLTIGAIVAYSALTASYDVLGIFLFAIPFVAAGLLIAIVGFKQASGCARIFMVWFGLAFVSPAFVLTYFLAQQGNWVTTVFIVVIIAGYGLYVYLIKAPTELGAQTIADLEGFRMYLKTGEEQRLNLLTPPERTPELFEKLLPYAIALDVENEWGKKFESILKQFNYQPEWYTGSDVLVYSVLTSSLASSLNSSIGSAQVDPTASSSSSSSSGGSWSSGSSGGGSSGGGGGGGGGGGW